MKIMYWKPANSKAFPRSYFAPVPLIENWYYWFHSKSDDNYDYYVRANAFLTLEVKDGFIEVTGL